MRDVSAQSWPSPGRAAGRTAWCPARGRRHRRLRSARCRRCSRRPAAEEASPPLAPGTARSARTSRPWTWARASPSGRASSRSASCSWTRPIGPYSASPVSSSHRSTIFGSPHHKPGDAAASQALLFFPLALSRRRSCFVCGRAGSLPLHERRRGGGGGRARRASAITRKRPLVNPRRERKLKVPAAQVEHTQMNSLSLS